MDTDIEDESDDDSSIRVIDEYEEEETEPSEDMPADDAESRVSGEGVDIT